MQIYIEYKIKNDISRKIIAKGFRWVYNPFTMDRRTDRRRDNIQSDIQTDVQSDIQTNVQTDKIINRGDTYHTAQKNQNSRVC